MIRYTLIILALIALGAWLNGQDIEACIGSGHSPEVCYATINP